MREFLENERIFRSSPRPMPEKWLGKSKFYLDYNDVLKEEKRKQSQQPIDSASVTIHTLPSSYSNEIVIPKATKPHHLEKNNPTTLGLKRPKPKNPINPKSAILSNLPTSYLDSLRSPYSSDRAHSSTVHNPIREPSNRKSPSFLPPIPPARNMEAKAAMNTAPLY